jgi:hypothetical protein
MIVRLRALILCKGNQLERFRPGRSWTAFVT